MLPHTHPLCQAADTLAQDIWEFQALAEHLNEPDNPTPLALVLRRHADRLQASYEGLDTVLNGGMGVITPMATQEPELPIGQSAAEVAESQLPPSCHDKHFSAN